MGRNQTWDRSITFYYQSINAVRGMPACRRKPTVNKPRHSQIHQSETGKEKPDTSLTTTPNTHHESGEGGWYDDKTDISNTGP